HCFPFGSNSVCLHEAGASQPRLLHPRNSGGRLRYRIAFLALLLSSLYAIAQSNYAVLTGSILDPQGQAVPGASITLKAAATGAIRHVVTNSAGLYEIPGLQPGSYELQVSAPRFGASAQPLPLEDAPRLAVAIRLQDESRRDAGPVGIMPEAIDVTGAAVGEVVEPTSIRNLPRNGRMLSDLVRTVPGAHVSHGAQTGSMNPLYWRPGQRSAVSV